jgi:hypothetical protein
MTIIKKPSWVLITALVAAAGAAYGTQPPDVVNSDDAENTAMGTDTLQTLTTGSSNTGGGAFALDANSSGSNNSAFGSDTLNNNTTGNDNTAVGYQALILSETGNNNTAVGSQALKFNSSGSDNTATGYWTLYTNTTGNFNTATGFDALYFNTTGNYNNASGYFALHDNTTGQQNSATGVQALYGNHTGNFNTASGTDALYSNTGGSSNIAEGYKAGYNLTTGSNNIDIGNLGVAAESATIRIGTTSTQTKTFIAGIYGTSVTGNTVVVSSTGQLGVTVSSERFKMGISPMGSNSQKLSELRPVTFHLKTDPKGALQYGLIAEEVAKVYPDLVIRDQTGRIDGVRYDELAPMLVNEMQQQHTQMTAKMDAQAEEIAGLKQQMAEMKGLKQELRAALSKLQANDAVVAQR